MFKTNSLGTEEARSIKFYEILTVQLKWMFQPANATPTLQQFAFEPLGFKSKLPSGTSYQVHKIA